jgi:hypothetical protein
MSLNYFARLEQAVDYLVLWLKVRAPKDSGNLSINAIKKVWNPSIGTWDIVIGGELAPYAIYTNEIWINRPGVNPNQGWVQLACIEAKPTLQAILSGTMSSEDVDTIMQSASLNLENQFKKMAISF